MTNPTAHAAGTAGTDRAAADATATVLPAPGPGPHAAETRRLYAADWAAFAAWCRAAGLAALPALPTTVAAHLEALSVTLKHGALARRAAAIADRHRRTGHPSPGTDPAVRAAERRFSTRVGLEDGCLLPDGAVTPGNAALVTAAAGLFASSRHP